MSSAEQPQPHDFVMPFLPVRSKGGPHDDEAYVAGYEMGDLDATLAAQPPFIGKPIHTENREQADLIAMRHGFIANFGEDRGDGWLYASFRRTDQQ